MLLTRYNTIDFVLDMNVEDGTRIIRKASEKYAEDRAFRLYAARFANYTEESYIPFDDFYKPNQAEVSTQSAEEILEDVKELLDSHRWG